MAAQQQLFETDAAPWEIDSAAEQLVASVVFPNGPEQPYDYAVPDPLRNEVETGRRVRAPLGPGNRLVEGYCVRLETRSDLSRRLKPLAEVVDSRSLLSPAMLRLTVWIAEQYLCSVSDVLEAILPAGVRALAGTRRVTLVALADGVEGRLAELKLSRKQQEVVRYLSSVLEPIEPRRLARELGCTEAPITALRRKGILRATTKRVADWKHSEPRVARQEPFKLNADQSKALDAILEPLRAPRHETILIHGVTGSGKTEVYMQAIQEVVSYGRQAIMLVPEISLTPQTRDRFRARFENVAVLHSNLRDAERHWHWERIARGEVQVVVGARSAVFAPVPHLGLIVLDEEHEGSFKQDSAPRYHARDVALWRAREQRVPLVLASATPSLESWYRASIGEYRLVSMPRRVLDRPLPAVGTIDLRYDFRNRTTRGAVSRQMHQAIEAALREGGQVILLLNRRGYSTHIQCPSCGHTVHCPNCDLPLTHHRAGEQMMCHYCEYQEAAPRECPECHAQGIRYFGIGTQRLENEIKARFRGVTVLRMDSDAMTAPGSHDKALKEFRDGKVQILLGTQMIAKGLDFPNVTLVGVINADTALHLPDFRAAERTFQLVTQVAGRTGRGDKGGRVLVQTFSPEHPAIQAAVMHDFGAFARQELPTRTEHGYPPVTSMIRVVARGESKEQTRAFAQHLGERLREGISKAALDARVLGPAPAPITRLRGQHRFHLQIQHADGEALRAAVQLATGGLEPPEGVQWYADVDPLDML